MTVAELIKFLQTQPQDIQVGYQIFSEQALFAPEDIEIIEACEARADGWIHDKRSDRPSCQYLIFPGN